MIDINKKYRTRDGREARIIAVDRLGDRPVIVLVKRADNTETIKTYRNDGTYWDTAVCPLNLIEVKEKHIRYLNIYSNGDSSTHGTKIAADTWGLDKRIACVRVEFEEGQFDE